MANIVAGRKSRASDFTRTQFWVYQSVSQNLLNSTDTEITFTNEVLDSINGHSNVSNTARYVPNIPGWYACYGQVATAVSTAGDRSAHFRKNGTTSDRVNAPVMGMPAMNGAAFLPGFAVATAILSINGAGDYISLWGAQNSGGTLATYVSTGTSTSFMKIEWYAPL